MKGPITRKEFLVGSVAGSIGIVGACALGASAEQIAVPRTGGLAAGTQTGSSLLPATAPKWPWPYAKLDREDVRKRAHKNYYDGGCCYGAFNALVSALVDTVGEPFTLMPTQMAYFGGGGGAGWGTLCGALNGAAMLISVVVDRSNASAIISELFGWYTEAVFPSDISNDYGVRQLFLVNKNTKELKQTIPGSTLCHASVSGWCTEAGIKASAPERAERCARLTADTAARTVELLNDFHQGQFRAVFVPPKSVTGCMSCHSSAIGNVQSGVKMDCQQCHKDNWEHMY